MIFAARFAKGTAVTHYMPMSLPAGAPKRLSGLLAIMQSAVSTRPAIDAAFCSAVRDDNSESPAVSQVVARGCATG